MPPLPCLPAAGAHTLRFGCSLWVYNCTGLPISVRQSAEEATLFGGEADFDSEDEVCNHDRMGGWGMLHAHPLACCVAGSGGSQV